MTKLLITGASSKFTEPILEKVKKRFSKIFLITNNSNLNYREKKIKHINFNLLVSAKIPIKVDTIIHMAAIVPYKKKFLTKNLLEENLKITDNILKYAVNNKIKKIIFISSTDVYPLFNKKKINLETKLNCHNEYGLSKIACEKLLKTYSDIFDISYVILRIGPIYSEKNFNCNKISGLLRDLKENKKLTINNPDDILSLLNLECASKAIVKSMEMKTGTFIITGPSLTKKNFFLKAKNKYQSHSKIKFIKKKSKKIKLIFDLSDQMKKFKWIFNLKEMFNNFRYEK